MYLDRALPWLYYFLYSHWQLKAKYMFYLWTFLGGHTIHSIYKKYIACQIGTMMRGTSTPDWNVLDLNSIKVLDQAFLPNYITKFWVTFRWVSDAEWARLFPCQWPKFVLGTAKQQIKNYHNKLLNSFQIVFKISNSLVCAWNNSHNLPKLPYLLL